MASPEDRLRLVREVHARLNGLSATTAASITAAETPASLSLPTAEPAQTSRITETTRAVRLDRRPATDSVGLLELLARRRSRYAYLAVPLPRYLLSDLVGWALGEQRRVTAYGRDDHSLGVAPAAGGLPSLDVYLCISRVEGVAPGIYRYRRERQELELLVEGDPEPSLRRVYLQVEFAERAAVTVCLVARLDVVLTKYSARHYRSVHVDAGVAIQNLYLVATALPGVGGCAVAGFDDAAADTMLGLGDHAFTAMLFAVGSVRQG